MHKEIKGIASLLTFLCVLVSAVLGYSYNNIIGMLFGGVLGVLIFIPEYVILVSYAELCEDIHIIRVNSQHNNTQEIESINESE